MSAEPVPGPSPGVGWEELFDELADLPAPLRAERLALVEKADPALAARLLCLLEVDADAATFLERPAPGMLGALSEEAPETPEGEQELPAGTRIGGWRLLRLIGRGGMGEVYLAARDEDGFTQRAALKLIKRGMDSRAIVRRFLRERQILSRLDHPGIARLLDGGRTDDGRPFFVMDQVEGTPLTDHCRERGLGLEERLRLIRSVCAAVDSAHRRLVVHRDLKPANILVTADGAVKLLDFGIAKLLSNEDEETSALTQHNARVLTPAYAAPEQVLGEPVTTATDVYALGVLLFELITGALPHAREQRSFDALAGAVSRETAERPSALLRRATAAGGDPRLARRVAGDLDLIVLTALHRDPARRYPSAAALADDLEHFLAGRPIRARPDRLGYRLGKFVRRHRLPLLVAALGLAGLFTGLGVALWQARAARLAAHRAQAEAERAERVKLFLFSVFRQSDPNESRGVVVTARELLERGAQRIDVELAGDPAMQAEMLDAVARIEINLGAADPALAHARRALTLRQAALPPGDRRIAVSRTVLGKAQVARGDMVRARRTLEAALAELIASGGADSLEAAMTRCSLADALLRTEEHERAIGLLHESLAIFRRELGDDHLETIQTLILLGLHYETAQRYKDAEKSYRQALAKLERTLGPRHPTLAVVQADLAGLLDRLSRTAEARTLFEQAIASQRVVLGPRHTQLASTLFSYGVLLLGQQEHAAADAALHEALAIYGPDRYEAAHCLRYLGISAMGRERYRDAAGLFTRAADIFESTMGADDLQRWRALANLGWAHLRLGEVATARGELAEAVASIERLSGPESYELRLPLKQLGEAQITAHDGAAAVATLERVRRLEEKLFGTIEHREVAGADLLLARAWLARGAPGDRQAARRNLDEALALFARVAPRDVLRGDALLESGRLALAEGARARARRELAQAEELLRAHRGPAHERTREAHRLLTLAGD